MKVTTNNGTGLIGEASPPSDAGSRTVERERLVLPVLVILLISLLANSGLIFSGAIALNRESAAKETHLARTLLAVQMDALEAFARDHLWWDAVEDGDLRARVWPGERLIGRLTDDLDLSSYWILAADGSTISGFIDGKPAGRDLLGYAPDAMRHMIDGFRAEPTQASTGGFLRIGDQVQFVAVGRTPAAEGTVADQGSAMVVATLAIDPMFLRQGSLNYALEDLDITDETVPDGYLAVPIVGEGRTLAKLIWRDRRPGDDLLKPISPALGITLLAIAYFLFRFMRGADLFLERQAFLASSLKQERKLRSLKSRFVSMVSHELRTPLATIRSATELLQQYGDRMSDKEREEEHKAIHRSVDSLMKLVDNVLVIGKSDWMESRAPARPVDVEALCREVWEETARVLKSKHRLEIEFVGSCDGLYANEEALRTVLSNLFQNAIKYSRGSDRVQVNVTRGDARWSIWVRDFGMGIPADEIDKVFEPFHRAKNAAFLNGTGLGLAVVKATVKSMGGEIGVESQTGVGTTFHISLPRITDGQRRDAD